MGRKEKYLKKNREYMKIWGENNPKEVIKRRKIQYLRKRNNPELWAKELLRLRRLRNESLLSRRKYESEYRNKNKDKCVLAAKKYRDGNPQWILANRLRSRVRLALKAKNIEKCLKTTELVGCSIFELQSYIEKQFKDGMTWANIHIDHKRPLASFNLSDVNEQKKAFHYSNLQPLWPLENLSKGAKIYG